MEIQLVEIPKIVNAQGNIGVIEKDVIPFDIKRVYYLYDVPSSAKRGGHAHKNLQQLLVPLSGSFDVILKNGTDEITITLNKPDKGLLINNHIWRELNNFSSGAVCMVLASGIYDEDDYIRNYKDYLKYIKDKK
ncbi:sugar 3,4-ketoisomerase [Flavobacterium sp. AG291]|uniref:sugar 3,4-ketoisomerase n=1 Tax=Flavobacterium sp. AG291 TaxID=2184000 RepID=UPI000E0A3D0A|nr:FdtA/QdtA family cupin domain-containing protein [Flavobacterium sp. AG291]RDI05829.1 WxcM-like protein [Flavobacterium sp. AG291]